ncbi:MAG: ribonuclease HII [Fimbriimonadaceae bacterium]
MVTTFELVAGVDEAGRGPLAGPVVAAAVIFPKGFDATGIDDSKILAPERREELASNIRANAIWAIEFAEVEEIDRLNILWATMAAMSRALDRLGSKPNRALIDGNRLPKSLPCPCEAVINGDAIHAVIGAASILAKTARDAHMRNLALEFPQYNFEKNFGYPTPDHLAALKEHGPCPVHRMSFAPCRPDQQPCLDFEN